MKAIVFVVAALAACALAEYQLFHPHARPCKYKMYCDEYIDYFMMKDEHTGYIKMVNTTGGYYEIFRCDYHNTSNECWYVFDPENKTFDENKPTETGCQEKWVSTETSEWEYNVSFYYHFLTDDFNYSKNETCDCNITPVLRETNHTSNNCTKYTNEETGYWIIADMDSFIIHVSASYTQGDADKVWSMVYVNDDADFDQKIFNSTFCNKTTMLEPTDVCYVPPAPASSSKKPASSSKAPTPTPASSSKKPASSSKAPTPTPASSSKKPASSFAATLYPAVAVLAAALVALLF